MPSIWLTLAGTLLNGPCLVFGSRWQIPISLPSDQLTKVHLSRVGTALIDGF